MKNENKIIVNQYLVNKLEAQIEVNEMIMEDYKGNLNLYQGMQWEIDQWKAKIQKCKENIEALTLKL